MNASSFFIALSEALGWTLIHSLWQGLIVLLVLMGLLVLCRTQSSHTRYSLSCLALGTLVAWMLMTFFTHFSLPGDTISVVAASASGITIEQYTPVHESNLVILPSIQESFEARLHYFIQAYASELVSLWFIGVCFFGLRWFAGLYYTYELKKIDTQDVAEYWTHQVQMLAEKLGIYRSIRLLESAKAEVPMVIGHLKPVILLPIGTLTGMTPQQIDAIIVHELAHIRRYDFLINLFLSLIEVVLFYHPAYWWMAKRITQERENCCDDIVVATCNNPTLYAKALLTMAEVQQQHSFAMALQGNKHQLLTRIKRICLTPQRRYRGETGKASIALSFLLILAAVVWAKVPTTPQETIEPIEGTIASVSQEIDADLRVPEFIQEIQSVEDQLRVVSVETQARIEEVEEQPVSPSPTAEIAPADTVLVIQQLPIWQRQDDPPLPSFPRIIRPSFPDFPVFPLSASTIRKKLQQDAQYMEMLRGVMDDYKTDVRSWKTQYKAAYDDTWLHRQDRVMQLLEGWKQKVARTYGSGSMEYSRAINRHLQAFEEALQSQEEVMQESEEAIQENMEESIQDIEDMLNGFEDQQANHNDRMRVHSDRMEMHGLRMEIHGARMEMHGTRMDVHGKRMRIHGERMEAHGVLMEALKKELFASLIKDGLHRKGEDLDFRIETDQLIVNGTKLTGREYRKYLDMVQFYLPDAGAGWRMQIGKNHTSIGTFHGSKDQY